MYLADFEIIKQTCPSKILVRDLSEGDETITSRVITITKVNLIPETYTFLEGQTEKIIEFDKDYVFGIRLDVTPEEVIENSIYTKQGVTIITGYSEKAKYDRTVLLEIDENITNHLKFKEESIELDYALNSAIIKIRENSLTDAQCLLDSIKEITRYKSPKC